MSASDTEWRVRELNRVALDMCALEVATDAARVLLFRRHLQASIRWASPVLLDALLPAMLTHALQLLRPLDSWPVMPMPSGLADPFSRSRLSLTGSSVRRTKQFINRFARFGVILRQPTHPDGGLALRVAGEDLEAGFTFGRSLMATRRGILKIEIPHDLPETVTVGAMGRPIGEVVGHHLLDGRDYPIARVISAPAYSAFEVRTGREAYAMPWDSLVERGS